MNTGTPLDSVQVRENLLKFALVATTLSVVTVLLVAFSRLRNIDAACFMGMTSGYLMDPKSAQSLLKLLCKILNIEVDMENLEKKAEEMESIVEKLKEKEEQQKFPEVKPPEEDLRYIG